MALHPIKLPKSAADLFRFVLLQKKLLKALANPGLNPALVDTSWVQHVWEKLDGEWVRKFCLGGQEARIKAIASASFTARKELFDEFCLQNKVSTVLRSGGNFRDLKDLPGFNAKLAEEVKEYFKHCYKLFSHNGNWPGYSLGGGREITKLSYREDFRRVFPTRIVCPYCDGDIGSPQLDHYLFKAGFPLLACSPWNLVPVCPSCNSLHEGKGERPALTMGPPRSAVEWLHPFFVPASIQAEIRLNGPPAKPIPQLYSVNSQEQSRLNNHFNLVPSISTRWTGTASVYFERLVRDVTKRTTSDPSCTVIGVVTNTLIDHQDSRGKDTSTMIKAAVCQAVLDKRPGYLEEFAHPNAPRLA